MLVPDILIAEDDALIQSVYAKKLSLAGFRVRVAHDGQKAIEEIERECPGLLVLDLSMPVLDGFGVLQRYPRDRRRFPIVVVTNFGDAANHKRAMELGADDFLVKSQTTLKVLAEKVDALLK